MVRGEEGSGRVEVRVRVGGMVEEEGAWAGWYWEGRSSWCGWICLVVRGEGG